MIKQARIALCFVDRTGKLSVVEVFETVELAKAIRTEDYGNLDPKYGRMELRRSTLLIDDEEVCDD